MLLDKDVFEVSFTELKKIWKELKKINCALVGGWAAHILIEEGFKKERNRSYIGSKDLDFAVLSSDLTKAFKIAESLDFFPISFRYCKIFSLSLKRFVKEREASKHPIHDLFYLFLDFITDENPNLKFTVFEDRLVKFVFDNNLFIKKGTMRVIMPEVLVLSKLRILEERSEDKRMKDLIDAMMVSIFYERFNNKLFKELSDKFKFDRKFAKQEAEKSTDYLKLIGFSEKEVANIVTSFESLL